MSSTTSTMLDCRDDYERAHQTIIHLEDAIFSLDGIEPGIVKYLKGKLKEAHLRCEAEKQKVEIERNSLRHYIKIKRGELARGYADLFYAVEDRDGRLAFGDERINRGGRAIRRHVGSGIIL